MSDVIEVLREHFPKDIAVLVNGMVSDMYLSEWMKLMRTVNTDFKLRVHVVMTGPPAGPHRG